MPDSASDGYTVHTAKLAEAGGNADRISERLRSQRDSLTDAGASVVSSLSGFSLSSALLTCSQACEDELALHGVELHEISDSLQDSARNYDQADAVARRGSDRLMGMLEG